MQGGPRSGTHPRYLPLMEVVSAPIEAGMRAAASQAADVPDTPWGSREVSSGTVQHAPSRSWNENELRARLEK